MSDEIPKPDLSPEERKKLAAQKRAEYKREFKRVIKGETWEEREVRLDLVRTRNGIKKRSKTRFAPSRMGNSLQEKIGKEQAKRRIYEREAYRRRKEKHSLLSEKKDLTDEERRWLERENARIKRKADRKLALYHENEENREKKRLSARKHRASMTKEQRSVASRRKNAGVKRRCASDLAFACLTRARYRIKDALKNSTNGTKRKTRGDHKSRFEAYFGCDKKTLLSYIEAMFREGMTWENRGQVWELDHIVPLSAGMGNADLLMRMNHYRNLQPLTIEENRRKHNSFPDVWPEGVPFTREEIITSYEKYLSEKPNASTAHSKHLFSARKPSS